MQLNIAVSAEFRRELRAYAKRHRVSMADAVQAIVAPVLARDRQ